MSFPVEEGSKKTEEAVAPSIIVNRLLPGQESTLKTVAAILTEKCGMRLVQVLLSWVGEAVSPVKTWYP